MEDERMSLCCATAAATTARRQAATRSAGNGSSSTAAATAPGALSLANRSGTMPSCEESDSLSPVFEQ